jgi:hypothetical protein
MVLPANYYDTLKPDTDADAIVHRPLQALLQLGRQQGVRPTWAMTCFPVDEQSTRAKLKEVMRFTNGQIESEIAASFAYATMLNGVVYYVF